MSAAFIAPWVAVHAAFLGVLLVRSVFSRVAGV